VLAPRGDAWSGRGNQIDSGIHAAHVAEQPAPFHLDQINGVVVKIETHSTRPVDQYQIPLQEVRFHKFVENRTEHRRVRQSRPYLFGNQMAARITLAGEGAAWPHRVLNHGDSEIGFPSPGHQILHAEMALRQDAVSHARG
jgi:hypothetical protein